MSNSLPRSEYPRPQFFRASWKSLNGEWEHEADRAVSGIERKLFEASSLPERITVPFCRESVLSGIGDTDFCNCVWYRKEFTLPSDWEGGHTLFHIGACDHTTDVWVNGRHVGRHVGGFVSFEFDITSALRDGANVVTVRAYDDVRSQKQPGGKQSARYASHGCSYTRTTGIWQSVWLEHTPDAYIRSTKYFPDVTNSKLTIEARTVNADGLSLRAEAFYEGRAVGAAAASVSGNLCHLEMKLDELKLWEVGKGRLYDLQLTLGDDEVESYFGMRSVAVKNGVLILNGKPVFQRLVLDQGFYPDGIFTAPTQAELFADIERSLAVGFNGARLHQKIFEPEFLSECDRRGYIVWGEHGNWGLDISRDSAYGGFIPEWIEAVERDFNHPAIIGWCPLNETQFDQDDDFVRAVASITRSIDSTRAYIDTSGWCHVAGVTDIMDAHYYEQDPKKFEEYFAPLSEGKDIYMLRHNKFPAAPTFVSEYGGIRWASESDPGWGYGDAPKTEEEFLARLDGLNKALCDNPHISAFCYTQLTDVEQEVNGLYTYDRKLKFPAERLFASFTQAAAIEDYDGTF